jgi:transposase
MSMNPINAQPELLKTETLSVLATLSKEQLIELVQTQEHALHYLQAVNHVLKKAVHGSQIIQERLAIQDQLLIIKKRFYGKSSEKRPKSVDPNLPAPEKKKATSRRSKLPSIRYPELPLEEQEIEIDTENSEGLPPCGVCEGPLSKMDGQTEDAEFITVTERTYHIVRSKRAKYCCKDCHSSIYTAPAPPRIAPRSQFSDEVAIDVSIAKYADHLPVERYVRQAARVGLVGVNHQTLIEQTHFLADFLTPVYEKIKQAIEQAVYLHSDETRWRMLEGDENTTNWQLWGFVAGNHCYYDARDTRAGTVIRDFLKDCVATHVMSDAFSGYGKGVKEAGKKNAYCNAHARRGFTDAEDNFPAETKPVIELYGKIYDIERELKNASLDARCYARESQILPLMLEIKSHCEGLSVLPKLSIGKARDYFLKYWSELTEFTRHAYLPIDNNLAERAMRGPVLGRKNFYGNHSKRGAQTSSILYSVIESCKLSGVEPQKYLRDTVAAMHRGEEPQLPNEYRITTAITTTEVA